MTVLEELQASISAGALLPPSRTLLAPSISLRKLGVDEYFDAKALQLMEGHAVFSCVQGLHASPVGKRSMPPADSVFVK